MNSLEEEAVEVACLGRPFQLGMLYDMRSNILIPGLTLWDNNELQRHKNVIPKQYTQMAISCSDSLEDKASSMDISGSLKISVMSGKVNPEGSAKYFNDNKKSTKQSRITLTYHVNTHFEHLTMDHLNPEKFKYTEVFDSDLGTHVVIAVLYGANAYFVFKRDLTSNEDKTKIEGSFKASVSSIYGVSVEGGASGEVNESEKSVTDSFSCTFYGDFTLPANPVSFEDAIKMYKKLPKMLGERGENAVPLKVWLYPLAKLDSKAEKMVNEISNSLITAVSDAVEALNIAEMRCDDLAGDTVAHTFPAFRQKIQELKENCCQYKLDLLNDVGSLLPLIHGGQKEEKDLADLLKSYEESPFSRTTLDQWLKIKEQESDVLKAFLKELKWTAHNVPKSTIFASPDTVACFTFTSLDRPDLFLDYLSEYMKGNHKGYIKPESWLTADVGQRMRKNLKLFKDLHRLSERDNIKFVVLSERNEEHPGACIMVVRDECDRAVCFTLPSKPTCSATDTMSHSSVTVKLSPACKASVKRNLEYKKNQEEEWMCLPVQQDDEEITLEQLDSDTEYQIRCTAVGQLNYTVTSDIITVQTLKGLHPPTDLSAINISSSSVQLCWFCPMRNSGRFVNEYIFEYRKEKCDEWLSRRAPSEDCVFTLDCLVHDTSYVVRISTDCGEAGVSDPSEELLIITKRDWMKIMEEAHERCYFLNDGPPSVYTLNLKRIGSGEFSKYSFGVPSLLGQENKTIMLLGATGSGKTTLINGMINYILGVDWEDDYRFKLPNKVISKAQVENQTGEVTAYHIHHMNGFQIPYSLTIIDTPGFGYTRGIVQDKAIADQICSFLCNQDDLVNIDAVCFVVQPSFTYLTSTQKYIFESVLSMFGNDIKKNIITLTTDGQTPPLFKVLHSDDVQCATFKFNNSAFFAENDVLGTEDNFGQIFWKMGKESMKRFFSYLNSLQTQSLQLTKEVLEERRQLELSIIGTQSVIQTGLTQLDVIKQTTAEVEQQQRLVDANKDFEEEVDVLKVVQVDISVDNEFTTNCLSCDYTCHYPCAIADNAKKMNCQAMTNGYCTVCPGKCAWIHHCNLPYIWETSTVREKRTNENLKRQYETALRQKLDAENRKEELEAKYVRIQRRLLSLVGEITRCLERLAEISLHTDPLSTPGNIDLLIQSELQEARLGSEKRMSELLHVRQQAVILQKIIRQEDLI